uniref:rolling circle replication-associated protein n=1 Tax=Devosia pacifica TaxID=1335967 RepID=UPI001675D926|nr:hypothetical protein [Devosia pacifica]
MLLTYSDVQKYFKLLRRHGYPVRYFVTGEYGSTKGRAHWHIMLYWQKAVPDHVLDQNFMEEHWPHGWSFWTNPTSHAVRYNCKYIQKDMTDDARQGVLAMSKKPPLGAKYFEGLAEQYARQGLAPQSPVYTFPDIRGQRADGTTYTVPFVLTNRSAELFLGHYVRTWRELYGRRHMPNSEYVEEYLDKIARKEIEAERPFVMPERARPVVAYDVYDWEQDFHCQHVAELLTYIKGDMPIGKA